MHSSLLKGEKLFTSRDRKEETETTKKFPMSESASMAPAIGRRLVEPLTMLYIFAAWMFLILNCWIR